MDALIREVFTVKRNRGGWDCSMAHVSVVFRPTSLGPIVVAWIEAERSSSVDSVPLRRRRLFGAAGVVAVLGKGVVYRPGALGGRSDVLERRCSGECLVSSWLFTVRLIPVVGVIAVVVIVSTKSTARLIRVGNKERLLRVVAADFVGSRVRLQ